MISNDHISSPYPSPAKMLLTLVAFLVAGGIASQLVVVVIMVMIYGDMSEVQYIITEMSSPGQHPELRTPILIIQAISSLVLFIVVPIAYAKFQRITLFSDFGVSFSKGFLFLFIPLLAVVVFPFISFVYEWNMTWTFPGAFGEWAVRQEEQLKEFTLIIMEMDGIMDVIVVFLIVGVIPAIGEEIVFRGLLQPNIHAIVKNHHVAIWMTAIIFGSIHFQFFGLMPRILLGVILGYLFYWSKSLVFPILFHLVNNGGQVILTYVLTRMGVADTTEQENPFPFTIAVISLVIGTMLLIFIRKSFRTYELENHLQNRE